MPNAEFVAIDTETTLIENLGQKIRTYVHVPDLVCVSFCTENTRGVLQGEEAESFVRSILNGDRTILFHNAAFDVAVLARAFHMEAEWRLAIASRRILDTRVLYASRRPVLPPNEHYSLKDMAAYLLGTELSKGEVRTSFRPGQTLTEEQRAYALQDAEATYDCALKLLNTEPGALVPPPDHFELVSVECSRIDSLDMDREFSAAAAYMAFELEPRGLSLDSDKVEELHKQLSDELDGHYTYLYQLMAADRKRERPVVACSPRAGPPIQVRNRWLNSGEHAYRIRSVNGRIVTERCKLGWKLNMKVIRDAFEREAKNLHLDAAESGATPGDREHPVSATGNISLDYKFWKRYADDLTDPIACGYLRLCKSRKLFSTYVDPYYKLVSSAPGERVKLRPRIGVGFTETGRWSCWGPNLQNQPKSLRSCFQAPTEDSRLVSADYKSLELFTACEAFHWLGLEGGPLRKLLDMGGDLHANTAALLFDVPVDQVTPNQRQTAKIANFSLLGGLGAKKFAQLGRNAGLPWTEAEAADMRWRWFNVFTDAAEFLLMFKVDPWDLCPDSARKAAWLDLNDVDRTPWPTRFELSRALNGGALYSCRLPSGRVVPHRRFSQAANLFFQGIGAEVITRAFNLVCDAGLQVCAVVHDSITVEAEFGTATRVAATLAKCMQNAQQDVLLCGVTIPLPEPEISDRWA